MWLLFLLLCSPTVGLKSEAARRRSSRPRAPIPEPGAWAQYPRGLVLLDELAATLSETYIREGQPRIRIQLGQRDLDFLTTTEKVMSTKTSAEGATPASLFDTLPRSPTQDSTLTAVLEIASRWPHGRCTVLLSTQAAVARMERIHNRRLSSSVTIKTLRRASSEYAKGELIVVVEPDSNSPENVVGQLQLLAARVLDKNIALVTLNPRLTVPSPVSFKRDMPPLLLSDFALAYVADADAFQGARTDAGVALYLRRPLELWRIFGRNQERYSLVTTTKHRPSESELRAVYCAAHAPES